MLEERLSSAYAQHTLGYGPIPGSSQYANIYPSMPSQGTDGKSGAENFYFGDQPSGSQPPSGVSYAQPQLQRASSVARGSPMSPAMYSQPPQPVAHKVDPNSVPWNGSAHHVSSPQLSNDNPAYPGGPSTYPTPVGAAVAGQYYAPPTQPMTSHSTVQSPAPGEADARYQPSPVVQRDPPYQQGAAQTISFPSAPEQVPSAEVQSPSYNQAYHHPMQPIHQRQPSEPAPQSYYYPQQPPQITSAYPQAAPMYQGGYQVPDASPSAGQPPTQHPPPPKPAVEESLIEL